MFNPSAPWTPDNVPPITLRERIAFDSFLAKPLCVWSPPPGTECGAIHTVFLVDLPSKVSPTGWTRVRYECPPRDRVIHEPGGRPPDRA